jgi:hypothetical protein
MYSFYSQYGLMDPHVKNHEGAVTAVHVGFILVSETLPASVTNFSAMNLVSRAPFI